MAKPPTKRRGRSKDAAPTPTPSSPRRGTPARAEKPRRRPLPLDVADDAAPAAAQADVGFAHQGPQRSEGEAARGEPASSNPIPATRSSVEPQQPPERPISAEERRLSVLVSSSVYGSEDLLDTVYGVLESYGYHVQMSHMGTIPVDPDNSAMGNCLEAVDRCDLFLGLILPWYGSGKEAPDQLSITHREALRAIELNKPRWFLVHEHVVVARQLLDQFRDKSDMSRFVLRDGLKYQKTSILSDLRVIELYEAAMRHDVPRVADRRGNWVQTFGTTADARVFVTAQFRRHRELFEKHLPRLRDVAGIAAFVGDKKR